MQHNEILNLCCPFRPYNNPCHWMFTVCCVSRCKTNISQIRTVAICGKHR